MKKQMICLAAGASLLLMAMTACGDSSKPESAAVLSDPASEPETSAAVVTASDNDSDFNNALAEMDAVAAAMAANDGETFVELLGIRNIVDLQMDVQELGSGKTVTQADRNNAFDQLTASLPVESGTEPADYVLGEPTERRDLSLLSAEVMSDISDNLRGRADADGKRLLECMRDLFWFDGAYTVPVTLKSPSAEEHTVCLYLLHDSSGWHPDGARVPMMYGYARKMRLAAANDAAKTLRYALISAITDLNAEDRELSLLDGTYSVSGEDFASAQAPDSHETTDEMLAYLLYEAPFYYKDAVKAGTVVFRIKDGDVTALALEFGEIPDMDTAGNVPVYGTAPEPLSSDAYKSADSLSDLIQ